jgi:hypothetical protein
MERTHVPLLREMGRSALLPEVESIRSIQRELDPFYPREIKMERAYARCYERRRGIKKPRMAPGL